jgi:pilus assembly protein Flp/PilA
MLLSNFSEMCARIRARRVTHNIAEGRRRAKWLGAARSVPNHDIRRRQRFTKVNRCRIASRVDLANVFTVKANKYLRCIAVSLTKRVLEFLKQEEGPTAVEYAVMLALIIVVCIAAISALGTNANATFSSVGSTVGS